MISKTIYSLVGEDVFGGYTLVCIASSQEQARELVKEKYGIEFSKTKGTGKDWNKFYNITDNRDISLVSESIIEL